MDINKNSDLLLLMIFVFLIGCMSLPAQTAKTQKTQAKKNVTMEEAKVYREAMVWFKKAEAMSEPQ